MKFNHQMHPRNVYKENPPSFQELALRFPEFRRHCKTDLSGRVHLDFKDPAAIRALTLTLLKKDFGLDVELPLGCLVPRLPARLNYVLWIEDLLKSNHLCQHEVNGIDIGTGASCIYPLLASKQFGWNFLATERDETAADIAERNVTNNNLATHIKVKRVDNKTALRPIIDFEGTVYDFCMCNPPFYDSTELVEPSEVQRDQTTKLEQVIRENQRPNRAQPHSTTVARLPEVASEGGEVAFVTRIIEDSVMLMKRVRIYTSMVGKKSSLAPLKAKLRDSGVLDLCETTFSQGKTQRWALAWTFDPDISLRTTNTNDKPSQPLTWEFTSGEKLAKIVAEVLAIFDDLKIVYWSISEENSYEALAVADTWSRRRHRKRVMNKLDEELAEKIPKSDNMKDVSTLVYLDVLNSAAQSQACLISSESPSAQCVSSITESDLKKEGSHGNDVTADSSIDKGSQTSLQCQYDELVRFKLKFWQVPFESGQSGPTRVEFIWLRGAEKDYMNQILTFCKNSLRHLV